MMASISSSWQRQHGGEGGGLPRPHLVAEPRRRPALDVEAEGQAGGLGRRPQPVPRRIAGIEVEHVDERAPVPEARTAFELGHRRLGRVAGEEGECAQPVGGRGVELLDGPVVPGRIADVLEVGLGDRERQRDGAVDHRGPDPVPIHVLEAQLRGAGPEPVVLQAGPPDGAQVVQRPVRWPRPPGRCRPRSPDRRGRPPWGPARPRPGEPATATGRRARPAGRDGRHTSRSCRPWGVSPFGRSRGRLVAGWSRRAAEELGEHPVHHIAGRPLGDDPPGAGGEVVAGERPRRPRHPGLEPAVPQGLGTAAGPRWRSPAGDAGVAPPGRRTRPGTRASTPVRRRWCPARRGGRGWGTRER